MMIETKEKTSREVTGKKVQEVSQKTTTGGIQNNPVVQKINNHCTVMEWCLQGAASVINKVLKGDKLDEYTNTNDLEQFGPDKPEFAKNDILRAASQVGLAIYKEVVKEINEEEKKPKDELPKDK